MAEPVELFLMDENPREVPAVLTNLSAGGMALVVFAHVSGGSKLKISLDVPSLQGLEFQGKVAWTQHKGEMTTVGVHFDHIAPENISRISRLAEDFQDCELKISFGLQDVCFRKCAYWELCAKPVKLKG